MNFIDNKAREGSSRMVLAAGERHDKKRCGKLGGQQMNYSKKIAKKAIAKRVIILCIIVAAVFCLIGGLIGYMIANQTVRNQSNTRKQDKINFEICETLNDHIWNYDVT